MLSLVVEMSASRATLPPLSVCVNAPSRVKVLLISSAPLLVIAVVASSLVVSVLLNVKSLPMSWTPLTEAPDAPIASAPPKVVLALVPLDAPWCSAAAVIAPVFTTLALVIWRKSRAVVLPTVPPSVRSPSPASLSVRSNPPSTVPVISMSSLSLVPCVWINESLVSVTGPPSVMPLVMVPVPVETSVEPRSMRVVGV